MSQSLNLLRAGDIVDTANSLLGLLLTTTLTWLVLCHSPREASAAYRRVLLTTCAMFHLNANVPAVKMRTQMWPERGLVYTTLGGWWNWGEWNKYGLAWATWVSTTYILVLPLQSTYRYLVICRGRRFTTCNFFAFASPALALSLVGAVNMLLLRPDPPDSERVRALLASDPIWVEDPPLSFIVTDHVS
jgi:Serpentine type 7TM GPCR chemoreceptor Str